ncbi:hypothetical protein CYMTET_27548 [Cymbomonas tetramitiformis]|uniref:Sulfotransferase n=1 Tax=Cymbomonas tetramitiformis TaxID=36881 RepID=A0AAE0FR64_9CHLO|nr:hypothetical protein CYMTET_27548 [Cymbomonas tetramitiformis]
MKVKTGVFYDKKGLKKFKPRISDVICAIPAKSGTTWVQQICHQIRVKGRPFDFDDQNDIMPWIERASYLLGTDLNAEHVANPRVFKSHLPYHLVPTGTKKIFCFRNMADTMLSFCKFALPRMGISTARALEFLEMLILTGEVKDRLRDARNWWSHRNDEDVLFIFFEDLLERPREVVTRIGKFMDPSFDDDKLVDLVVDQTNHRAMAAHPTKFDDHRMFDTNVQKFGLKFTALSESERVGKVRQGGGKKDQGNELPQRYTEYYEKLWKTIIEKKYGFKQYSDMREAYRNESLAN